MVKKIDDEAEETMELMRTQEQEITGCRAKIDLLEQEIDQLREQICVDKTASERESRLGSAISKARSERS